MTVTGDLITPLLDVNPFGPDTLAALIVVDPAEDAMPLVVTPQGGGSQWFGEQIRVGEPGEWLLNWTVTGTGADVVTQRVVVDPGPNDIPTGFSYANTGDLVRYSGRPLPTNARRVLIDASREIERITKAARYTTDDRGYALDPALRTALADATCELVGWWDETGTSSGGRHLYTSASIGPVSVGWGGNADNAQKDRVGPRVWTILLNAGLLSTGGVLYG